MPDRVAAAIPQPHFPVGTLSGATSEDSHTGPLSISLRNAGGSIFDTRIG